MRSDHVAQEGLGVPEHLVLGPQPTLDEAGQPGEGEEGEEVRSEEVVGKARALGEEPRGLGLAERDVTLLLPRRGLEEPDDLRGVDGVDERLEDGKHQALADGHLGRHVLGVVRAHRAGGEEADHRVGRPGRGSEEAWIEEDADVRELLGRLPGEEGGRLQRGRGVEPVADLDAGDLAVEELVDDPAEELLVARAAGSAPRRSRSAARHGSPAWAGSREHGERV